MPSSTNRKRLEVPIYFHLRLVEIAAEEHRTITGMAQEIITLGLEQYQFRRAPISQTDWVAQGVVRITQLTVIASSPNRRGEVAELVA
jgi:hypothetical protein